MDKPLNVQIRQLVSAWSAMMEVEMTPDQSTALVQQIAQLLGNLAPALFRADEVLQAIAAESSGLVLEEDWMLVNHAADQLRELMGLAPWLDKTALCSLTVRLPEALHEKLRHESFQTRRALNDLMVEAITSRYLTAEQVSALLPTTHDSMGCSTRVELTQPKQGQNHAEE